MQNRSAKKEKHALRAEINRAGGIAVISRAHASILQRGRLSTVLNM